ncbi:MAG: HAMP domain-containing protein [Proteobacteria bacterium]|nr:HAMP domain-containing protein [Pseudomonadota bacterium]
MIITDESTIGAAGSARRGLSVTQKVLGLVMGLLLLLGTVAGTAIYQINNISEELVEIAEHDLPMTMLVTKLTTHQLEQAIALQQSMRYGEEMQTSYSKRSVFDETVERFEKYAGLADEEFKEAEAKATEMIEIAGNQRELDEFSRVMKLLEEIDVAHATYELHAREVLAMMREGNIAEAIELSEKVEAEELKLDASLEELLTELENFTLESAIAAEEHEVAALRMLVVLTILAILFGIVGSILLVRAAITGPLGQMTTAMRDLAGGDETIAVPATERGDEIGEMARAVLVFKENMIRNREMTEEQEAERSVKEKRAERLGELFKVFDQDIGGVVEVMGSATTELESTAQSMSSMAEQSSSQASNVATASNQASANVQTVATAAEELSASVAEISRQVNQSARIAGDAVEQARSTNATVQGLAEAASRIGEVVTLINDIAGQTNLLALNATIEAARAGEAGKGFAVVAQEVKNLANQTAKATEDISTQVLAVQNETNGAVSAIEGIQSIIGEISDIATTIASAVEEQGVSTQEIARNVQQAAQGTQEVNANIGGVTEAAQAAGAAATQVLSSSNELSRQGETLRGKVNRFLDDVRAA